MGKRKGQTLHTEGKRGYTVSVVTRADRDGYWLRWWDPSRRGGKGDYARRLLEIPHGTEDALAYAKQKCKELAGLLLSAGAPTKEGATGVLTIAELFAAYRLHKTARKKPREAAADLRRINLWIEFLTPARDATTLDLDMLDDFAAMRRAAGISDTTIGHETVWLRGVLNWATSKRTASGKPLLSFSPLPARMKRLRSEEPNAPVATARDFLAVYRYSDRVDSQRLLRPFLMLAHEHGWRLSAWRKLWASDIDLAPWTDPATGVVWPHGRIRKRPANDKKGKGKWVPMTRRSARAARRLLRRSAAIGDAYLFRSPKAREVVRSKEVPQPWQEQHALDLLHRTENYASDRLRERRLIGEGESVRLGGFHALRRKWATERKGEPIVDVAEAGDWHPATLWGHYQKPDAKTTLRVVTGGKA